MRRDDLDQRLSKITTIWTVLRQAHGGPPQSAAAAQQLLAQRYGGAVYRYLLAALRDPHAADDLTQEFHLGLVRGEFHRADPGRGRFRDYVKTALFHLVSKYRKRQQAQPRTLASDDPAVERLADAPDQADRAFRDSWRDELLARTWAALAAAQPAAAAVLRSRTAHPELSSAERAERLAGELGKPLTAAGVRQMLHRARECFADLLLEEVAHSVEPPTAEEVEQELRDLDLWEYCRPALERRARG